MRQKKDIESFLKKCVSAVVGKGGSKKTIRVMVTTPAALDENWGGGMQKI